MLVFFVFVLILFLGIVVLIGDGRGPLRKASERRDLIDGLDVLSLGAIGAHDLRILVQTVRDPVLLPLLLAETLGCVAIVLLLVNAELALKVVPYLYFEFFLRLCDLLVRIGRVKATSAGSLFLQVGRSRALEISFLRWCGDFRHLVAVWRLLVLYLKLPLLLLLAFGGYSVTFLF